MLVNTNFRNQFINLFLLRKRGTYKAAIKSFMKNMGKIFVN